ncbi:hypothetical protein BC629DRAFT_916449 [Irpex lacteus]|nr:hypothetical protein BC629DRAFT_916449 [Irpex lacteus]
MLTFAPRIHKPIKTKPEVCPSDQNHNGLDEVSRAIFQHSGKPTAFRTEWTACVACRRKIKCSGTIPCTRCCSMGEKDACVEAPSRQRRKIRSTPVGAATQKPSSTTENFESRRKQRKLISVDEALTDAGASMSDENPKSVTPSKSGRLIRWVTGTSA